MKKILAVCIFSIAAAAPVSAQQATGMSAMGYYVGTWACVAGPVGRPPVNATATFVMNGDVLSESVSVPAQTGMKAPLSINFALSYDPKGRFIQTSLDSNGSWGVSYANPWTGNTEQWTDLSNSDGKLGHGQTIRTDQEHFTFTGYPTPTGTTPDFKGTCQRQSS